MKGPWEGWSDPYREVLYHGGIPETYFWPYIQTRWGASDQQVEDLWAETVEHPYNDEFWQSKAAKLEQIEVPALVVASWSDHGLHTRGTLEGFRRISSEKKWLLIHGRKKWSHYYDPENVAMQRQFFDHFLKGAAPEPEWPKVRYELRTSAGSQTSHTASAWPFPETEYRRLHLSADSGLLVDDAPKSSATVSYDSLADDGEAIFELRFDAETAIAGHSILRLWISADDSDDADLFVALEKLDKAGEAVGFVHYAIHEDGPAAMGWLRVSQREKDEQRSQSFLPVLAHRRTQKIEPGVPVEVEVEIWPSGTLFAAGEGLRLRIAGRDLRTYPKPLIYARHEDTVNRGAHRIWTGDDKQSWLQLPFLRSPTRPMVLSV